MRRGVRVRSSPERLYHLATDIGNLSRFFPLLAFRPSAERPLNVGDTYFTRLRGTVRWTPHRITVLKPDLRMVGVAAERDWLFEALKYDHRFLGDGGETTSRERIDYRLRYGFVGRVLDSLFVKRLLKRQLLNAHLRLKKMVENSLTPGIARRSRVSITEGGEVAPRKYWFVPVALFVTLLYGDRLRAHVERLAANVRAFDLPTAGLYDALIATLLERFYDRVAEEVVTAYPQGGAVLEVGSGPGRLAVRLGQRAPGLVVTGVDISPEMVERASHRAHEAGLAGRVRFEVGDVGALPFAEATFDGVVSTLSLHHWPDPALGLAEIHRVLKPGEEALIYDLAHWLWRPAHGDNRLVRLASESPFGGGEVKTIRWPGAVPAFVLLRLRRAKENVAREGPC